MELSAEPRNHNPGGLPPVQSNVDLVGKLDFAGHNVGDVSVYKGFAYLNSWAETDRCRGGTYVADISNPAQPQQVGFLPAAPETYHGEGAHVITISTPSFTGDVLTVSNERCGGGGVGGFDLYDVTDPANPVPLTQGFGDFGGEGSLTKGPGDDDIANSAHSIFMWQDGGRAYCVLVDNQEVHDVDIFDITNPRSPQPIEEFDLFHDFDVLGGLPPYLPIVRTRDAIVRKVNGVQTMLVSYWDAGYVALDVDDPANPQLISDFDYPNTDPFVGTLRPEGNAHSAEFSWDGRYLLGADEDFNPFRAADLEITTGSGAGLYPAAELPFGGRSVGSLSDHTVNGPTVYGGYGCSDVPDRSIVFPLPLPPGEDATILFLPGSCETEIQIENAEAAGYDVVIVVSFYSFPFCFGAPADVHIASLCATNNAVQPLFGSSPTIGDVGESIEDTAQFDGWGYAHLFRSGTNPLQEIDSAAIGEALDPGHAYGFGNLSVHELATDPTENLAYASYYSGGLRVFSFGDAGLIEQGAFVPGADSSLVGVEQFTTAAGERLIAASDRDFGLYIFRYTGPGAAKPPVCTDSDNAVGYKSTGSVSLRCSDANNNPLSLSVVTTPGSGTLGAIDQAQGRVDFTDTGDRIRTTSLTYKANDGAADSATATARISIVAREGGACFNPFFGTGRLEGSEFGDRLEGASANDLLLGLDGADCLFGLDGDDSLLGGADADQQSGGNGNDRVAGEAGNDNLNGDLGNDLVLGGAGADRVLGGPGADNLNGGGGRDRFAGGAGNDRIAARDGSVDTIDCGQGRDTVVNADRTDRIGRNCEKKPRFKGKKTKKKKPKKKPKKKRR